ncbi:MAG: hypothetical protein K6E76_01300 [Patescibacteria group bacterium]|nr:hypothetical protein [Patescibacteria group bacterium]
MFILCLRTPFVFHLIGIEDEFWCSIILGTLFIFSFLSSPSIKEDDEEDQGELKKNEDDLPIHDISQPSNIDHKDRWKDILIGVLLFFCLISTLSVNFFICGCSGIIGTILIFFFKRDSTYIKENGTLATVILGILLIFLIAFVLISRFILS